MPLGEFLSALQLMEELHLQEFELVDLLESGVTPYDDMGQPIPVITQDEYKLCYLHRMLFRNGVPIYFDYPEGPGEQDYRYPGFVVLEEDRMKDIAELEAEGVKLPLGGAEVIGGNFLVYERSRPTILRLKKAFFKTTELNAFKRGQSGIALIPGPPAEAGHLDRDSPHYSTEYAAESKCQKALFGKDGPGLGGKNSKQAALTWLKKHYSGLSEKARQRIATLVNPDESKKGGATPTSSQKNKNN